MLYIKKGGSPREGGPKIFTDRRLADDGKRLEALDVVFRRDSFIYKGGSLREGGPQIGSDWRLADDGKGWDALDVLFCCDSLPLDKVPQCTARVATKIRAVAGRRGSPRGRRGSRPWKKSPSFGFLPNKEFP